jgi:hypothetical protein
MASTFLGHLCIPLGTLQMATDVRQDKAARMLCRKATTRVCQTKMDDHESGTRRFPCTIKFEADEPGFLRDWDRSIRGDVGCTIVLAKEVMQ